MNEVSCGHRLVYETLDSIDEVLRSQDPKTDLSCFLQKLLPRSYFLPRAASAVPFFAVILHDNIYFP
jgi:hypothetical protein